MPPSFTIEEGARMSRNAWVLAGAMAVASLAHAGKAHEHGVARLDIGVEAGRVVVALDMPLDNLVGFERAPRTDAERAAVAAAVAKLREAATLFRIDGAAGCTAGKVELVAAAFGLGAAPTPAAAAAPAPAQDHGHADLEGSYEFTCTAGARAGFVETGLFEAFPRLKRLEVQVATPRGQMKATLRRPNARIALAR
jgi:hypothetical protein